MPYIKKDRREVVMDGNPKNGGEMNYMDWPPDSEKDKYTVPHMGKRPSRRHKKVVLPIEKPSTYIPIDRDLLKSLIQSRKSRSEICQELGITYSLFYRKLKNLGLREFYLDRRKNGDVFE